MCTEAPWSALNIWSSDQPDNKAPTKKNVNTSNSAGSTAGAGNSAKSGNSKRLGHKGKFVRRSPEEIKALVKQWEQYAHPRAREFFPTQDLLEQVLQQLARGIHNEDDPVLGDDGKCVYWYGDITKDDQQAAIRMIKPGEANESITYVNRVLAFVFATDESFQQLMQLPKEPFCMSCGEQLCVNLAHISLQVHQKQGGSTDGDNKELVTQDN